MSPAPTAGAARAVSRAGEPYVGLVPYDEDDAAFFFGRSQEIAIVGCEPALDAADAPLRAERRRQELAAAGGRRARSARAARATPASSPFAVCVVPLLARRSDADGARREPAAALQELAGTSRCRPPARRSLESLRAWTEHAGTLLVVLDQFEEYFQYHPDEGDGETPARLRGRARAARQRPDLAVNVLLSIREDAWAKLDRFEGHIPLLFANYLRVDHLDLGAAREAIEGPIAAWNRTLPRRAALRRSSRR